MKFYMVQTTTNDPQVFQVKPELEAAFMKEYAGRIIASGNSLQEVLIAFNEFLAG